YGTIPLLAVNSIAHFYTTAHVTAVTALKQIDNEFEAISASLKVPFYRTFARVTVPVCMPAILDIAVYMFVNALTTVSAVIFLYGASTKLASISIVHMDEAGATAAAAAVSTPCLNAIAKAEGIWIEDVAGRRTMDFHGNNVHHIGYGHPRLKKAIAEQMEALPFAPRRYANAPAVALAKKLSDISPFGPAKALFTTGGSDAIEVAVKIARAATGRFKTLSFWDAFHGAGIGAAALSGEALFRSGP